MISRQHRFSLYVIVPVLLDVWMDVTSGQSIQLIPQYPLIQGAVTLRLTGITGKIQNIIWFKGANTNSANQILNYFPAPEPIIIKGPFYHDRISVSPDGSLIISNLNTSDEGNYIAKIQTDKPADIFVYLKIYVKVGKPTIAASPSNPIENDTVTLTCTSTNAESIAWSRIPSGGSLSSDNKTMTISSITRSDAGDYSCTASNPASKETSDSIKITVAYGPENVKIKVQTMSASSVSLECSATSDPPATYQWKRNGTDIKDNTNPLQVDQMKDEGTYTCVATNSATKLTATSSVYVNSTLEPTVDNGNGNGNTGLIIGVVIASIILVLVLVAALVYLFIIKKRRQKNANGKTDNSKNSTRNGQTIPSPAASEQPELQYADIVFSKNRPKRPQPAPDMMYANRADLARPQEVVYSELKVN